MSLRDYFAAKALSSMRSEDFNGHMWASIMADQAYAIADAMIAARNQTTK